MEYREQIIATRFLMELLELYEFELLIDINDEQEKVFRLKDLQEGNLGNIEADNFMNLADIIERLDVYHEDYIYQSLEERKELGEIIENNDWDLIAQRFIKSNWISKILISITPVQYLKITKEEIQLSTKEVIDLLDKEENFYKRVYEKYPLIREYGISNENKIDFFQRFSFTQLDNFEHSLYLYYIAHDIVYDEDMSLISKEGYTFNNDIIRLSCGLINYDDFIKDFVINTSEKDISSNNSITQNESIIEYEE